MMSWTSANMTAMLHRRHVVVALSLIVVFQLYIIFSSNADLLETSKSIINNLAPTNVRKYSSIYDKIFERYTVHDYYFETDLTTKCDLYFATLFNDNNNWFLDPNQDFDYDMKVFEKKRWLSDKIEDIRKELAKKQGVEKDAIDVSDAIKAHAELLYSEYHGKVMAAEQKYVDIVSNLRIFSKCYLMFDEKSASHHKKDTLSDNLNTNLRESLNKIADLFSNTPQKDGSAKEVFANDISSLTSGIKSCDNIEARLFPWLTNSLPVYKRWNGETRIGAPNMADYIPQHKTDSRAGSKTKSKLIGENPCFLNRVKNSSNGKGIVLTINDGMVDDTVNLIRLLRGLNNQLPIEIVYYDGLNEKSQQKIINAARDDLKDIPRSFDQVEELVGVDFPPQEVWFVSVFGSVSSNYRGKFTSFGNKFLACFFNSFEEYILIDADTVFFKDPEFFFSLENYVKTGAFFFKDRSIDKKRAKHDLDFFHKILPNPLDNLFFNIPLPTNSTLNNEVFDGGLIHLMESGLVVIDKKRHFDSILMMIQIYFHGPTRMRVYGDKELFWLGFSVNGDESYHFNKYHAAAVGELTPDSERNKVTTRELCTNHPAHVYEKDVTQLLWMNTGYKYCSHIDGMDWEKELNRGQRLTKLKSTEELQKYYKDKLIIKHAIVPPADAHRMSVHAAKDEPTTGWAQFQYCEGYMWCAYESFGNEAQDNLQQGQFVEFSNVSQDLFNYYGDLWVGGQ